jgi:alpha-L-rhamnosidase
MNVFPFFEKWMKDLACEQFPSGKVPNTFPITNGLHNMEELEHIKKIIPTLEGPEKLLYQSLLFGDGEGAMLDGSSGWGDTATITPYTLYLTYGDKRILENQYDSAQKWVEFIIARAKQSNPDCADEAYSRNPDDAQYVWDSGFHWGEWLEPQMEGEETERDSANPFGGKAPFKTATMYYFYSSHLLSEMASILGKKEDAAKYKAIAAEVKRVYNRYFIKDDGTIIEGKQAPNVRALAFGLADDAKEEAVAAKLNEMLIANSYKLNTGFLSTAYLLNVLADKGYIDTAYRTLLQEDYPGWLYNVKCGATTILEHWNGYNALSGSFNHYSYGAVCDFLFSRVAGIAPLLDAPGYRRFTLKPMPACFTHAEASFESPFGRIASSWKREGDDIHYSFEVPPGTEAEVTVPGQAPFVIGSGVWDFQFPNMRNGGRKWN